MFRLICAISFLTLSLSVVAQEPAVPAAPAEATAQAPAAAADAPGLADVQAAYKQGLDAYRAAILEVENLRGEYQTANKPRQAEINTTLREKIAEVKTKVNALVDSALAVYKLDPKADPEIAKLLLSVVEHSVVGRALPSDGPPQDGGDNYERALPLIEALISGGEEKPELPVWGFIAAFVTNDFELADKYLKIAEESGVLSKPPEQAGPAQDTFGLAMKFASELPVQRELWIAEEKIRATETDANDLPQVKITTNKGAITVELFENQAPIATANFISLVKKGFYNNLTFHRVLPHFMAQGGCPNGDGKGSPGYSINCECNKPDHRKHFRGTLSMAHAGPNTGGSQVFLTFIPTSNLNGVHTAFGRVIEGIEVLGEIQKIDPDKQGPFPPDRILKAEVLRDRGHGYEFEKLPGR